MAKKIVLFSGGVDSYCLSHAVDADLLVYFPLGLPENERELETLHSFRKLPAPLKVDDRFMLADQKLPNETLPMRNIFLIMGAMYYGPEVYLAATSSSTNRDKNPTFGGKLTDLLQYVLNDPTRNPEGILPQDIAIKMPFKTKTKSKFVAEHIAAFGRTTELLNTRSCYAGGDKECGVCQSCIRKFMAFINNDLPCDFEEDPAYQLRDQYGRVLRAKQFDVAREVLEASTRVDVITAKEYRDALRYVEKKEDEDIFVGDTEVFSEGEEI